MVCQMGPKDQHEVKKILREYADVFPKDDLDLGQTLVTKHKITLKEGAKLIKECYRRAPPGLYDEVQKHLQEMIDGGIFDHQIVPWLGKRIENFIFVSISGNWIFWWLRMPIAFHKFKTQWTFYMVQYGSPFWI